ncbi:MULTISPECIES: TrkH family potassium uptake protein [Clostridium]|jgi:trk system potassium uptake protein TrkH|uniref:Potassium transporter KefA n=1 Tax=Clostridium butyricum TaxID=1492 RepID=A0A0N8VXK4_CLOBU|nr:MULTISPECIES: TrkH family potassium uptake protein [Clostridium]ETI89369.1 MAG: Cation transporter [Clostridium butyricum DORA_1]AXB84749.1 TrkH family potassium uptake protein [Clostridium butyricum]EMU54723.1 putative Trk system potassium uptake protein TrkH [Clostridium butyricum DKU-01]KQB78546.1 potassium transporter KefA [Clostridium butyricum]MBO1685502.1 TrkH family potassium uptake protein [Clostridium butyricum]
MNYKAVLSILGNVVKYMVALLFVPLLIALYYGEGDAKSFLLTILIGAPIGFILSNIKAEKKAIYAKEGFLIVGFAWIIISAIGALPFVISGAIPSFIDAFFETVSGFTTTGATILTAIEGLPKGILFWRSFTHWIGGMGFLIFMLALIPSLGSNSIHLLKAESPGPSPGKIVPKIKETAKILYLIYFALTLIEGILLMCAGMNLYDAVIHAMGTAGTGGFSNMNASIAAFNSPAIEWIITIFMLIFGINFALYFQILKGNFKGFFKNEELRYYLLIIVSAFILITVNIISLNGGDIILSIRQSAFQVSSIVTSTGFATVDFNFWPTLSKLIIVMLMFVGAMAGSTGGGIKTVRIVIMLKAIKREINKIIHPKRVNSVKIDGKTVDEDIIHGVFLFIGAYIIISLIAIFIISFDNFDVVTTVTSVITTMSNIGPGLEVVGPAGNFAAFSPLSKLVLSFCMLAGRLEIYPMLIMFSPSIWRKNH